MDWTLIIRFIAVIAGVVGAGKVIYELVSGVQPKLREEYKFAKEFLQEGCIDKLHPYTREKGYQAIAGSTVVTQKEIEYILSLSNPAQRLKDYKKSLHLFEKMSTEGDFKLEYLKKYSSKWSRGLRKTLFLFGYFLLAFISLSPVIVPGLFGEQVGLSVAITLPSFGFYAWMSMSAYSTLKAAERLMVNREFHTSNIVLDSRC